MILTVRVIPRASKVSVEKDGSSVKVHLTRPAQDGEANRQLISVLAEHLGVKKHRVTIARGAASRTKLIRISDED